MTTSSSTVAGPHFVPCVEDCLSCARHPDPAANDHGLICRSVLTGIHLGLTSQHGWTGKPSDGQSCADDVLTAHYATLWARREAVPEFMRREWLETALTCVDRLGQHAAAFDWLLGHPLFLVPSSHSGAPSPVVCKENKSESAAAGEIPQPARKRGKRRTKWVLWEDAARGQTGVHYLTIPTATPNAFRPQEVLKLEGNAFPMRVRAWLAAGSPNPADSRRIGPDAFLSQASAVICDSDEDTRRLCRLLAAMQPTQSLLAPRSSSEAMVMGTATLVDSEECQVWRLQLRSAVRYRMLLEITCCRLHNRPRCTPSWRLLADTLDTLLRSTATTDVVDPDRAHLSTAQIALVLATRAYILRCIIPYLTMRDRHVSVMHNTLTHAMREELLRTTHGGLWTSTLSLSAAATAAKAADAESETPSDTAARINVLCDALQALCSFNDVAPPEQGSTCKGEAGDGTVCWTAVLGYTTGADGEASNEPHDTDKDVAALFTSAASRRRCLGHFVGTYLLASPVEAFDRVRSPTATADGASTL